MPGLYRTTFMVEGNHAFPFDMLRYDGCHPEQSQDAAKLDHHIYRETRKVRLVKYHVGKDPRLTPERWGSFLWGLDQGSVKTIRVVS